MLCFVVYPLGVWREWWSGEALPGSFFISQRRNAEREGAISSALVDTLNCFSIAFVLIVIKTIHWTLLYFMIDLGGSNWWMWIGLWQASILLSWYPEEVSLIIKSFMFTLFSSIWNIFLCFLCWERYFEKQFELAYATKLPMFLHMRAAAEDFCEIVERNKNRWTCRLMIFRVVFR